MTTFASRGKALWDLFRKNLMTYQRGPQAGTRKREIIWGVTPRGTFVNGMTVDAFLARAGKVLLDSGCFSRWEDTLCFEDAGDDDDRRLSVIATRQRAEPGAPSLLSNLLCVGVQPRQAILSPWCRPPW